MVLDKYSANFLFTIWKRVRKYGACCTGLTQNVDDLLQSHTAQTMLANSEFLVMLNQASTDRLKLARLLNISDNQLSYITNVDFGRGLIKCGSAIVPFMDTFPKHTQLYKRMTTKPSDLAAQQKQGGALAPPCWIEVRYIDKIKEKPQVHHTLKERVKSAPKKLIRRGLDDGTERLRGQLWDVAQHGQRDDFGGDQLGDAEVSGVKRAEQLAERLLGRRKKGAAHNPDTGPNGHSGRHDPQGAAKPRDDDILPPRDRLHGREARDPLQAQSAVRGHPQPQSALQKPQKRSIKTKDAYLKIQADPAPATPPSALQQGKASFV